MMIPSVYNTFIDATGDTPVLLFNTFSGGVPTSFCFPSVGVEATRTSEISVRCVDGLSKLTGWDLLPE